MDENNVQENIADEPAGDIMVVADSGVPAAAADKAPGEPARSTEFRSDGDTDDSLRGGYASVKTKSDNKLLWIAIVVMAIMSVAVGICSSVLTGYFMRRGAEPPAIIVDDDPDALTAVVAARKPAVVEVFCGASRASGVVMKREGGKIYILTNNHATEGGGLMYVRFYGEDGKVRATIAGYDSYYDVAVLIVSDYTPKYNVLSIDGGDTSGTAYFKRDLAYAEGDRVVAIGNAMGYGIAAYQGIISRASELLEYGSKVVPVMRTTAAINAGMSGGALFDTAGYFVGLNTYRMSNSADAVNAGHDTDVEDTGYVLPAPIAYAAYRHILEVADGGDAGISSVMEFYKSASYIGCVRFSFTGFGIFTADYKDGRLTVSSLDGGLPPANIVEGDVLTHIGGVPVTTDICRMCGEVLRYRYGRGSGAELKLSFDRGGAGYTVTVEGYHVFID